MRSLIHSVGIAIGMIAVLGCSEGRDSSPSDVSASLDSPDSADGQVASTDDAGSLDDGSNGGSDGRPSDWPELLQEIENSYVLDEDPDATVAEVNALAASGTDFALSLFRLMDSGSNTVFSPYSLYHAFAMYYWANAPRRAVMEAVFGFSEANFLATFNKWNTQITTPAPVSGLEEGQKPLTFLAPTAIFYRTAAGAAQAGDFVKDVVEHFGAKIFHIDAAGEPAAAAANYWFNSATSGLIPALVSAADMNPDWIKVTASGVFFEGSWADAFPVGKTQKGTFNGVGGPTEVDMMNRSSTVFQYEETDSAFKVSLPYLGGGASMVIIMPKDGQFDAVRNTLTSDDFRVSSQGELDLDLTLPKFSLSGGVPKLQEHIGTLEAERFGEVVLGNDPFLAMIHKGVIEVDESGSRAAAATAIIEYLDGAPEITSASLVVDKPFIFSIVDAKTGMLLFLGQYVQ